MNGSGNNCLNIHVLHRSSSDPIIDFEIYAENLPSTSSNCIDYKEYEVQILEENNNNPYNNMNLKEVEVQCTYQNRNTESALNYEKMEIITINDDDDDDNDDDNDDNDNDKKSAQKEKIGTEIIIFDSQKQVQNNVKEADLKDPKLNCNDNVHNTENLKCEMKKKAFQICDLLPKQPFDLVYETLLKNQDKENCVELTLLDLLSSEKPNIFIEQKNVNNNCIKVINEYKNSMSEGQEIIKSDNKSENQQQTKMEVAIISENNQDSIKHDSNEPKNNPQQRSIEIIQNPLPTTIQNELLRPPKLIVSTTSTSCPIMFLRNTTVLAPSKFTYIPKWEKQKQMHVDIQQEGQMDIKTQQEHQMHVETQKEHEMHLETQEEHQKHVETQQEHEKPVETQKEYQIYEETRDPIPGTSTTIDINFDNEIIEKEKEKILTHSFSNEKGNTFALSTSLKTIIEKDKLDKTKGEKTYTHIPTLEKQKMLNEAEIQTTFHDQTSGYCSTEKKTLDNEKSAKNMIDKLTLIFPQTNCTDIKQICQTLIKQHNNQVLDKVTLWNGLIDYLVKNPEKKTCKMNETKYKMHSEEEENAEKMLLEIFPDADPEYLKEVAHSLYKNPKEMQSYIESKLDVRDYPTYKKRLMKKKLVEQEQYISNFNIPQFLEIFPQPEEYFNNSQRQCKFDANALQFLKQHFRNHTDNLIIRTYRSSKYNLTVCAQVLRHLPCDAIHSRQISKKATDIKDISLLQEIAFVIHRRKIRQYIDELREKEKKEIEELKRKNALLECLCCGDDQCIPSKCSSCDDGHVFCKICIIRGTEVKLADGETHVPCFINCGSEFSLPKLQEALPPTKFSIFLRKKQEMEIMAAGLEGLVSCPFCHFASIPPPEDKVFKCLNPECMRESCRLCRKSNHIPKKCEDIRSKEARQYLEEKMTEAFIRKCYLCNRSFLKEEGCNKMTCICGAQMCYICDRPVNGYDHFNAQGASRIDRCPLWSNADVNVRAVRKVAQETVKNIKERDPHIKLNVNAILPDLPGEVRGPHEYVDNANMLPKRAKLDNF